MAGCFPQMDQRILPHRGWACSFCCAGSRFGTSWFWLSWDACASLSRIPDWAPPPRQAGVAQISHQPPGLEQNPYQEALFPSLEGVAEATLGWGLLLTPQHWEEKEGAPTVRVWPAVRAQYRCTSGEVGTWRNSLKFRKSVPTFWGISLFFGENHSIYTEKFIREQLDYKLEVLTTLLWFGNLQKWLTEPRKTVYCQFISKYILFIYF